MMRNYGSNFCFPEGWKISKIKETFNIYPTASYSRTELTEDDLVKYIHYGDIHTKFDFHLDVNIHNLPRIPESRLKNFEILKDGDLVIADASEDYDGVGKAIEVINIGDNRVIAGLHTFHIRDKSNNFAPRFKGFVLLSSFVREQMYRLATGTKVYSISKETLKELKLPLPPLPEQNAIADCLTTWDDAIEKQTQLIKAKEERHKALMQQLLSGKKRLPSFTEEWKEVKLGDLGLSYSGLSGKDKNDFGIGSPYVSYLNVFSNTVINPKIYELVKVSDSETQNEVKYGDILFTVSSETQEEAGMSSVFLEKTDDKIFLNSFCFGVRLNDFNTLLPRFGSFLFRFQEFRKEIFKISQGSTRFNISKKGVLNLTFKIPTIIEQKNIIDVLENSENEISLEKQRLSQLKEQKKALMQKLLTGKVRLPFAS